jgi:hypothetical protein
MINWWYILEFATESYNLNVKQIVKLLGKYVLPTIITVSAVSNMNNIFLDFKDTIINLIAINFFYIGIVHLYVQKKFFMKLDEDIIIKFIPNKAYNYIILKIFIMAYIPLITPSILVLSLFFVNLKPIFYLCSLIVIVSAIVINVLMAVYWRYLINTSKKIFVKISNYIFLIFMFILFAFTNFNTPVWILSNLEKSLKHQAVRSIINLNVYVLLVCILIAILSLVIFKYLKGYLKFRARILVFNRNFTSSTDKNKVLNKIVQFYQSVYSGFLSTLEKEIFKKDVKELIGMSRYSFVFVFILQVFNIGTVLVFNFLVAINTVQDSIIMSKLLTAIVIGQVFAAAFVSKATFENEINIEKDFDVLEKYNIKFTKNNVIRAKTRIISAIVSPKIYLVFTILIISSIVRSNNYLGLLYLLSMIQLTFIKKTMEIWRVKSINKLNSESEVIKLLNIVVISFTVMIFVSVYQVTDKLSYIQGQIGLIIITVITYIFHSTINNVKSKGDDV